MDLAKLKRRGLRWAVLLRSNQFDLIKRKINPQNGPNQELGGNQYALKLVQFFDKKLKPLVPTIETQSALSRISSTPNMYLVR